MTDLMLWTLDDDHNPVAVTFDEIFEFAAALVESYESFDERFRVAYTQVDGDCFVSTVFLFGRPAWTLSGRTDRPRLFETMVFGGDGDQMQRRYATWDEALTGHQEVVDLVMQGRVV